MLSRLHRVRLSPLARTTLVLTAAGVTLALTPAPPATSLPLPAHPALAPVARSVAATADQGHTRPEHG